MSTQAPSLYERLGGKPAVDAAVEKFYEKVLSDRRIRHFFDGVDMKAQRGKQKIFMTYAFGGPVKYDGKDMRTAHQHLVREKGLDESHFNAVAELLVATLKELDVPQNLIDEVVKIVSSTHDDVLDL